MTLLARLSAPFPPATVSWRLGATTQDKSKGMALAYIDARDVQDRLNEVCGHEWQVRHPWSAADGKVACEIGIKVDGEWIWRGDGAGNSDVEAEKGAFSDSFKRAAVRWGIGRYLYDIDSPWVELEQKGRSYVMAPREMARLRSILMGKAQPRPAAAHPTESPAETNFSSLSEMRDAIIHALEIADSPFRIDGILRVHARGLAEIRLASIPTYDRLMRIAGERRGQLVEPPRIDAGSAPELLGEP